MGNLAALCHTTQEAAKDVPDCQNAVHEYLFPMYVVKVLDFLQMKGAPEPHHVLRQKGLLHEWQPGMFATFDVLGTLNFGFWDSRQQQLGVCSLGGGPLGLLSSP